MGAPTKVRLGPGNIYAAPVGSTEPTDLATALNVAWVDMGYTEEGHVFSATPSFEPVEVAEEIDPISWEPTGREMAVEFALAEMTSTNLSRALNGGTVSAAGGVTTYLPPLPNAQTRIALLWQSADAKERWVFRKCIQVGDVQIARKKAPNKAVIPVRFMLEIVAGSTPFKTLLDTTLLG